LPTSIIDRRFALEAEAKRGGMGTVHAELNALAERLNASS
jgi:hypothetical protein